MRVLKRVLYVEDESDIQTVAKVALELVGGLVVLTCSSGDEALREAEAFTPDMIVLDVMMPGRDGPNTLKALRELPTIRQTPIAFMTAKVQPAEVEHYKSLGACDVIIKPFDPMTLAKQISDIWINFHRRL